LAPQPAADSAAARHLGGADLRSLGFLDWPFAFWMAAYGAPLAYLVIIAVYARTMNRADERADEAGEER